MHVYLFRRLSGYGLGAGTPGYHAKVRPIGWFGRAIRGDLRITALESPGLRV